MEKWNQIQTLSGSNRPHNRNVSPTDERMIDYYGCPYYTIVFPTERSTYKPIHIIDENTFVIGAPNWNDDVRFIEGATYIYTKSNGVFYESQFLTASNSKGTYYYGNHFDSCIMSGTNYLFIGAYGTGAGNGRVYILTKSLSDNKYYNYQSIYGNLNLGGSWPSQFGWTFQIDKENYTLVVGSPTSGNNPENFTGNVHIFTASSNYWYEHQILYRKYTTFFSGYFGIQTAISGNIIIASQYTSLPPAGGFNQRVGSVHIFTQSNITLQWNYHQDIFAPNPKQDDYFGINIDFKKDNILITRPGPVSASNKYPGCSVYLYTHSSDNYWDQDKIFYKPSSAINDYGMISRFDYSGTNIWLGCTDATASINTPTSSTVAGMVGECYVYNSQSNGNWDLILQTNPIVNSTLETTSSIINLTTPGTIMNSCYVGDLYKDLMIVSSPYTYKSGVRFGDREFAIKVFSKSPVIPPTPCTLQTIDQDFILNHYICNIRQNTDVDGNAITTIPYGLSPYGLNLRRFGRSSPLSSSFD